MIQNDSDFHNKTFLFLVWVSMGFSCDVSGLALQGHKAMCFASASFQWHWYNVHTIQKKRYIYMYVFYPGFKIYIYYSYVDGFRKFCETSWQQSCNRFPIESSSMFMVVPLLSCIFEPSHKKLRSWQKHISLLVDRNNDNPMPKTCRHCRTQSGVPPTSPNEPAAE